MFCGSAPIIDVVEPDFTVSGSRNWERQLTPDELKESMFDRGYIYYTAYMYPSAKDPDWPLASYWPVYLSNFRVNEWDSDFWYHQVSDFFASYGLLTRMMYFPVEHDEPREYSRTMKRCCLIEGLVYFCSERDAKAAIAKCHRALNYGHRVNVLPGRTAEYFDNKRSVRFIKHSNSAERKVETTLENRLNPYGEVEFTTRHSIGNIIMQFKTLEGMLNALSNQIMWKPIALKEQTRKQRFLEADWKSTIQQRITSDPGFMDQKPRPHILQFFTDGTIPIVENIWKTFVEPLHFDPTAGISHLKIKRGLKKRQQKRLAKLKDNPEAAAVKQPKGRTRAQNRADVLKSVNWFLRTNKKPLIKAKDAKTMVINQIRERRRAGRLNS